ncbi:PhzF family phenazine biosynthesis protein [Paenibacillus sp. FSL K6-4396]|uniref:PhzF family phenazine biosynthesis protein n=1 Tax=Paenibacillus sp. FSL K6-4396 TaxID=2921506 RepID=UPI0030FCBD6A
MEVEVSTLHAFSDKVYGGNPAGVVLQAAHLSETQMQEIARQVGFFRDCICYALGSG